MVKFEFYKWEISENYTIDKREIGFIKENNNYELYNGLDEINKDDKKLFTNLYPEPYIGDVINAKVIFLALNPGVKLINAPIYKCQEELWYDTYPEVRNILNHNLNRESDNFPQFYFDDNFLINSPGHEWINKRANGLLKELSENGIEKKDLIYKIASVQYFPYHSVKFKNSEKYLPSQISTFKLLETIIKSKKLIVCLRAFNKWNKGLEFIDSKERLDNSN